nr:uncharacterized protein LOC113811676 [Penaeus vannamei]
MAPVLIASLPRSLATCVRYGQGKSKICWSLSSRPIGALGIRYKSTPAAASLVNENAAVDTASQDDKDKDPLDLTFCDYRNAFKSKTNSELLRALLVFHLCSIQPWSITMRRFVPVPRQGSCGRSELLHVTLLYR